MTEHTKVISLAQITNVLGYLAPIKICNFAHEHDIIVCVDGAQSAPHHAVDVQDLDVDFFAFQDINVWTLRSRCIIWKISFIGRNDTNTFWWRK